MRQIYSIKAKIAAVSALMLLMATAGYAQVKITGTVRDDKDAPIVGATIMVPNSSLGVISDAQGRYSITVPSEATQLTFNSIGYTSESVVINNRTVIDVKLQESMQDIEEVVVIGYGGARKSDLTGAVVSVKIAETEAASTPSFERLLQGRVAGVQVTQANAAPGGVMEIIVRGASSFNMASEPLYVVDGIVLNPSSQDNRSVFSIGGATGGNNDQVQQGALASINPSDILSMEVLKDASATAIYGSEGANGVILITTKQGTSKKPSIKVDFSSQASEISRKIPLLNLDEFRLWREEISTNIPADTVRNVDWQDEMMRRAWSNTFRISISGKSDNTSYMFAGNFTNSNGIIQKTSAQIGSLRINLETTVNKTITFGSKTNLSFQVNNMTLSSDANGTANRSMIRQMLMFRPYRTKEIDLSAYDDEEDALEGPESWLMGYQDLSREWRVTPNLYARLNILPWLTFNSTLGGDFRRKLRTRSFGNDLYAGQDGPGRAGAGAMKSLRYNWDNVFQINYKFKSGHRINGTLGMAMDRSESEDYQHENNHFPDPKMKWGAASIFQGDRMGDQPTNYNNPKNSKLSFFARGIYSYKDRYSLTTTFRADGSSKFAPGNKYSYFPSFACAWNAGNESFLKKVHQIDQVKLRVGWGMTGNSNLSPYQTLRTYNSTLYASYTSFDPSTGAAQTGYLLDGFPNLLLKWETNEMYNIGLDLSFFKSRLSLTTDVYYKNTWDLLNNIQIPASSGVTTIWGNRGSILNKGLEISLDGIPISTPNFRMSLGANISFNRNKILDTAQPVGLMGTHEWASFLGGTVGGGNQIINHPANIFITGKPLGLFYGLQTDGIIQVGERGPQDLAGNDRSTEPGYVKFVDQNGDGAINDDDYVIIGNPNPKFTGGFYCSFGYRNLTLECNFTGVYGNDILNGNLCQEYNVGPNNPNGNGGPNNNIRPEAYFQAWRPDAPSNKYPALGRYPGTSNVLDRWIEDGSYLRLSNISLSWRIPLKKTWINAVNLTLSARNLWIWTNYSGFDPEVNSFAYDATRLGVDWSSYPTSKSYILNVGLTF